MHLRETDSMTGRVLVWGAWGIAVTAAVGLALDFVWNGLDQTTALAGVVVAFCELVALALHLTGSAKERRSREVSAAPVPTVPLVEPRPSPMPSEVIGHPSDHAADLTATQPGGDTFKVGKITKSKMIQIGNNSSMGVEPPASPRNKQ
jgi:hypothetical protein